VTIRTKEPEPPEGFPPVRLFLDDIEEIVRALVDAHKKSNPSAPHEDAKIKVTFAIKDQVCDEVGELPKIVKKTNELSIQLESETVVASNFLRFNRFGSTLDAYVLTEEEHRRLFHKLAPIFKRRNLRLRTVLWAHNMLLLGVLFSSCFVAIGLAFIFMLKHAPATQPMRSMVVALLVGAAIISFRAGLAIGTWHSVIILRHSSEQSPLRQELLQKFPLVAMSTVLTFLLTLLGFYLKHKYWP